MTPGDDTMARAPQSPAGTGTAHRVLAMLTFLADRDGPVTVQKAAEGLGLAASTTHRLLNLLRDEGYVSYLPDSRSYEVGPRFQRVALRVASNAGPVELAKRNAAPLVDRYDETILLGLYLPQEYAISFAARVDGQKKLLYQIEMNRPLSLLWGASGKSIMAWLPDSVCAAIHASEAPAPATGAPVPSLQALAEELARIRQQGYAISDGEKLPDARGIAAPVFGPSGVIGSLCLTSPRARFAHDAHAVGADVARAAAALSADLGGRLP